MWCLCKYLLHVRRQRFTTTQLCSGMREALCTCLSAQSQVAHDPRDAWKKQALYSLSCNRSILLRLPVRHEIRGPASLLAGKEAEFNQVGLFSTHKCGRPSLYQLERFFCNAQGNLDAWFFLPVSGPLQTPCCLKVGSMLVVRL